MNLRKYGLAKLIIIYAAELAILALLMCGWFGLSIDLFGGETYSILGTGRIVSLVGDIMGGSPLFTAATALIYVFFGASIIGMALTCITAFRDFKGAGKVLLPGFIIPLALSALVILIVIGANAFFSSQADGFALFKLTAAPFFVLALSAGAVIAVKLISKTARDRARAYSAAKKRASRPLPPRRKIG